MYRLPDGWSEPEIVSDVFVADEVTVRRAGVASVGPDGEELCGSAAETRGPALARAWFELLERVSAIEALRDHRASYAVLTEEGGHVSSWSSGDVFPQSDAPERWTYARSNGIALHTSWGDACRRAFWELAERDRVVRAWHGEIQPRRVDVDLASCPLAPAKSYEWRVYAFPEADPSSFSVGIEVVGVFGFPTRDEVPFVLGLAGRPDTNAAIVAAETEALQLLAFLWGEPIPAEVAPSPSAMQHLDMYQVGGRHAYVRRWLEGAHAHYGSEAVAERRTLASAVGFVDLTPPWLGGELRVAKAVCKQAVPLVFGDSPLAAHLPKELRLHPIP